MNHLWSGWGTNGYQALNARPPPHHAPLRILTKRSTPYSLSSLLSVTSLDTSLPALSLPPPSTS
eukprot:3757752-Pyramimonas_sp.AAC.1